MLEKTVWDSVQLWDNADDAEFPEFVWIDDRFLDTYRGVPNRTVPMRRPLAFAHANGDLSAVVDLVLVQVTYLRAMGRDSEARNLMRKLDRGLGHLGLTLSRGTRLAIREVVADLKVRRLEGEFDRHTHYVAA